MVDCVHGSHREYVEDGEQYENDDQVYVEQLDDGEYIEEEHEMTLDEFYAQAQK